MSGAWGARPLTGRLAGSFTTSSFPSAVSRTSAPPTLAASGRPSATASQSRAASASIFSSPIRPSSLPPRPRCGGRARAGRSRPAPRRARARRSGPSPSRASTALRHRRQRLVGLGRAPGEAGEAFGVQSFFGERAHQRAQPRARIGRIGVGRVLDERDAAVRGRRRRGRPWRAPSSGRDESRRRRAPRSRRHAGEAGDARAAHQPEQHRLGLVVGMVGGGDRVGADRARVGDQQPVARLARPLLQAGSRASAPVQTRVACGTPSCRIEPATPPPPPRSRASGRDRRSRRRRARRAAPPIRRP